MVRAAQVFCPQKASVGACTPLPDSLPMKENQPPHFTKRVPTFSFLVPLRHIPRTRISEEKCVSPKGGASFRLSPSVSQ